MSAFDDILGGDAPFIDDRSEKAIQNDALVALWQIPRSFWWRENTGTAWQGKKVKYDKDVLVLADARPVKFGLEGIADIMGHCQGHAIAIEMKDSIGRQRTQQKRFEAAWTRDGGIYILARTVQDAVEGVLAALRSHRETTC
ncbi:MAG: hypothetical protein ABIS14_01390 [Sphingomonas sp.]